MSLSVGGPAKHRALVVPHAYEFARFLIDVRQPHPELLCAHESFLFAEEFLFIHD